VIQIVIGPLILYVTADLSFYERVLYTAGMERILSGTGSYGLHRGTAPRPPDHAALQLPDGRPLDQADSLVR